MTFAEAAMIMMGDSGGSSGKVKPITITKNGDYTLSDDDKNAGYIGYTPVHVNVTDFDKQSVTFTKNGSYSIDSPIKYAWNPIIVNVDTNPIINSLSVSEPGTYHAYSYSCNGFDPVIVSDKYKKLYEQAKGNGENIDTGITDKDGNEITLDNAIGIDYDDVDDYVSTILSEKDAVDVAMVVDDYVVYYEMGFQFTTVNGKKYVDPLFTMTNGKTGESVSYLPTSSLPWTRKLAENGYKFGGFQAVPPTPNTAVYSYSLDTLTNPTGWLAQLRYTQIGVPNVSTNMLDRLHMYVLKR